MKTLFSFLIILFSSIIVNAQTPAEQIAEKIARKMKDSLQLTDVQKTQIYQLNIQISDQKTLMRNQYTGSDSLRVKTQMVENTRDSLYHTVLSDEKYWLYIQKKRNLVNNN